MAQLHTLCYALGAREEEVVAVTCGRFAALPPGEAGEQHASLEVLRERLDGLWRQNPHAPLIDLSWLTLEAQLWPHAARGVPGRHLLAEAYTIHADHLSAREQWGEMGAYAERALALMPEKTARREPFWVKAGMAAAHHEVRGGARPSPRRGPETLRHWLSHAREPTYEAWILERMAEYQLMAGGADAALTLAERACRTAEQAKHPMERRYRQKDRAMLLRKAGRSSAALPFIVPEGDDPLPFRLDMSLLRVEVLLDIGQVAEAHDWLLRARSDIERNRLDFLQDPAQRLARRF